MSVWKLAEKIIIFASLISSANVWGVKSSIRHSVSSPEETPRFVKNTPLHLVISTLFSVLHLVMKHCVSCLKYYIQLNKTKDTRVFVCLVFLFSSPRLDSKEQQNWSCFYCTMYLCHPVYDINGKTVSTYRHVYHDYRHTF